MSKQVSLSAFIYPQDCLAEATAAYSDICTVKLLSTFPEQYEVSIESLVRETDEKQVVGEFLNYLLDRSVEYHLGRL